MNILKSFSPIADKSAQILILDSMPGVLSLQAGEYYAHPRNAFWRIMSSIFGFSAQLPYESRARALKGSGVAVWDVNDIWFVRLPSTSPAHTLTIEKKAAAWREALSV